MNRYSELRTICNTCGHWESKHLKLYTWDDKGSYYRGYCKYTSGCKCDLFNADIIEGSNRREI